MPGTVSGVVFDDLNANGTQDPGEQSLADINLQVVDLNTGAVVLSGIVTDAGGNYRFDAGVLTSNNCELQVLAPFDFAGNAYLFDWDPTAQNGPIVANFGLLRIE